MRTIHLPVFDIVVTLTEQGGGTIEHPEPEDRAEEGVYSMILAHAVAGVDIEDPAYLEGVETALLAIGNHT